jgi:magnesium-protoporphyrin O-methyltransferase
MNYNQTLSRVETYFDKTATQTWERLTSDAPVSRIRQTVRAGRDQMRAKLLSQLPNNLDGARVLDAGCGVGQVSQALAERGAKVTAIDISPSLIEIAQRRIPSSLHNQIEFVAGDMNNTALGSFDYVLAMDSLIYYSQRDLIQVLDNLLRRTSQDVIFTVAPKTPLLMMMWYAGKLAPRGDKSPTMVPHSPNVLARALGAETLLSDLGRVTSGFYISHALGVHK